MKLTSITLHLLKCLTSSNNLREEEGLYMCQFKTSPAIKHILVCLIFIVLMRYSNFNKRYSQNAQEDQKKKKGKPENHI